MLFLPVWPAPVNLFASHTLVLCRRALPRRGSPAISLRLLPQIILFGFRRPDRHVALPYASSAKPQIRSVATGCSGGGDRGNAVEGHPAMRVHPPAVEARRKNADAQDRRPAGQLQEMEQRQPLAQAGAPAHVTRLTQAVGDQPRNFLRRRAGIGFETGRRGQQTQQPFERDEFFQQRNQRCQQPDMSAQNQPASGGYGFRVLQQ